MRSLLLLALLLSAPRVALADARADIVDLRHDRSPTRHELLGWTATGEAAFRWIVCSEGGERTCRAAVGTFGPGASHVTTTLDYVGYDRLSTADAITFIRAEETAIAALGVLAPATPAVPDAVHVFGDVGGAPTEIRARVVVTPDLDPGGPVRVAVHGPGGRHELGTIGMAYTIDALDTTAYASPDGSRVALAFELASTSMCWSFTDLTFVVADVASVRVSL